MTRIKATKHIIRHIEKLSCSIITKVGLTHRDDVIPNCEGFKLEKANTLKEFGERKKEGR